MVVGCRTVVLKALGLVVVVSAASVGVDWFTSTLCREMSVKAKAPVRPRIRSRITTPRIMAIRRRLRRGAGLGIPTSAWERGAIG